MPVYRGLYLFSKKLSYWCAILIRLHKQASLAPERIIGKSIESNRNELCLLILPDKYYTQFMKLLEEKKDNPIYTGNPALVLMDMR